MSKRYNNKIIYPVMILFIVLAGFQIGKNSIQRHIFLKKVEQAMEQYGTVPEFLKPVIIPIRDEDNENEPVRIFSVPFKNSIGTFDLDNEVKVIEFTGNEVKPKTISKLTDDFPRTREMNFGFLPINDKETYFHGRGILSIIDMTSGENIGVGTEIYGEVYKNVTLTDSERYRFLCNMNNYCINLLEFKKPIFPGDEMGYGRASTVSKIKFELEIDQNIFGGSFETIHRGIVFLSDPTNKKMMAYATKDLTPVNHPLSILINKQNQRVVYYAIHPVLPFMIYVNSFDDPVTGKYVHFYYLVRWEHPEEKKRITPFPLQNIIYPPQDSIKHAICDYEFSPDGKWLIVKDLTGESVENPMIFAYPVIAESQEYIGKPIRLGKAFRDGAIKTSSCWIQDPQSYVVCDGMLLYKWDLSTIVHRD